MTDPFRYDGRMQNPNLRQVESARCLECGRLFTDGDKAKRGAHVCCARHAEAAEAVGQSGYPGCGRHV